MTDTSLQTQGSSPYSQGAARGRLCSLPTLTWPGRAGGKGTDTGDFRGETGSTMTITNNPIPHPLPSPKVHQGRTRHLQVPRPRGRGPLASGGQRPPSLPSGALRLPAWEAPTFWSLPCLSAKPLSHRQPRSERLETPGKNRWLLVWRFCVPGTSHVIIVSERGKSAAFFCN